MDPRTVKVTYDPGRFQVVDEGMVWAEGGYQLNARIKLWNYLVPLRYVAQAKVSLPEPYTVKPSGSIHKSAPKPVAVTLEPQEQLAVVDHELKKYFQSKWFHIKTNPNCSFSACKKCRELVAAGVFQWPA